MVVGWPVSSLGRFDSHFYSLAFQPPKPPYQFQNFFQNQFQTQFQNQFQEQLKEQFYQVPLLRSAVFVKRSFTSILPPYLHSYPIQNRHLNRFMVQASFNHKMHFKQKHGSHT